MLTDQELRCAVATAVLAPSLHNSQPWSFHRHDDRIVVRADPARWLRQEDPLGRELMLSCGGAVRHLVLDLRAQGLDVSWELAPDADDAFLIAHVDVTGRRPATLLDVELHVATRLRHSDRSRFSSDPVMAHIVDRLRGIAELEGCFLADLDDDRQLSLAVVTDHADRVLRTNPGMQAEAARWTSATPFPSEGVPAADVGTPEARRGSPVTLRQFGDPTPVVDDQEPPVPERPTVLVLGTDSDARADWIACGWTLSDLLLTLTCEGLVASPMTQSLELPADRVRLQTALGLTGYPQMVLRVGYPAGTGSPHTGRREVTDVLA